MIKIKTELSSHEILPEDWGGDNIFAPVSAKTGEGIDSLIKLINKRININHNKKIYY